MVVSGHNFIILPIPAGFISSQSGALAQNPPADQGKGDFPAGVGFLVKWQLLIS